jgi:hypothetical protein
MKDFEKKKKESKKVIAHDYAMQIMIICTGRKGRKGKLKENQIYTRDSLISSFIIVFHAYLHATASKFIVVLNFIVSSVYAYINLYV